MTTYTLTIGFIPNDWTGDTDGTTQVLVGDPDFSQTIEYDYEIDNDFIKNITTGKVIKAGRNDDPFADISKESANLSNGQAVLSDSVLSNIYALCLDEAEEVNPQLDLLEDGLVFFLNEDNKYNGCFYCKYLVEEDDEIEIEKLFIVNNEKKFNNEITMTFDEWDGELADQGIELEDAAEAMGLEMSEIESWQNEGYVPDIAINFIKAGQDDMDELMAYGNSTHFTRFVFGIKNDEDFNLSIKSSALGIIENAEDEIIGFKIDKADGSDSKWTPCNYDYDKFKETVLSQFARENLPFLQNNYDGDLTEVYLAKLADAALQRIPTLFTKVQADDISFDDRSNNNYNGDLFVERFQGSIDFDIDETDGFKVLLNGEVPSIDDFYAKLVETIDDGVYTPKYLVSKLPRKPQKKNLTKVDVKKSAKATLSDNQLTFKLVVTEGDNAAYTANLSYEAVANVVSNFVDHSDNDDFFKLAANHPASTVREQVAYKDNISPEVVDILQNDTSISVLRNLVNSSAFRSTTTQQYLEKIISLDAEIAQNIASNLDSFQKVDTTKLATLLASNPDPSVVARLASNYNTPKKILKMLINHEDPYVASEAKSTLDN